MMNRYEDSIMLYKTTCIGCHRETRVEQNPREWDPFVCPKCYSHALRDFHYASRLINNFISDISNPRLDENIFFLRLDHFLKKIMIEGPYNATKICINDINPSLYAARKALEVEILIKHFV